ncbi:MAG: DNA-binding response regulator [Firmicutes bacterium HGW-Firmicutes-1]|jgi:two-component system alkaline phosphatase synthesis response regulator PhoP|nr:MAG: DNA-binding response regulator [Firmicutes bacterium HGW-Firmicutes-1]
MKKVILTVDDEQNILELLKYNLEKNGYEVLQADTGEGGLRILNEKDVDMILLDLMLPGIDGLEVLKTIRSTEKWMSIPVIMLTAKSEEIDKVLGLEMGADDYLSKPFGIHELMARIKAVARRTEELSKRQAVKEDFLEDRIKIGDIMINKSTHEVVIGDKVVELPLKEFELLYLLAKNKGRVFDREYLLEKIWGYDYFGETRTVDVHIRNIRKKIEVDDSNPIYIKTVRGIGYKFS